MRAREFVTEARAKLSPDEAGPMRQTYIIPGIRNNDAYHTYRLGMAIARARADVGHVTDDFPPFPEQSAFGQNAVVSGFDDTVVPALDQALKLTGTTGGKVLVSTPNSEEPPEVSSTSPIKPFKGYR
jgi:hypothetical protein